MPYNPSSDLVGLWRAISGGVEKGEMPGLDFVVAAMSRAGLMRTVTSQTAPTVNQSTTAWFKPAAQSFASEGTLFLWDPSLNMYVPATPELFHGGSSGGGGGGGTGMVIISGTAPVSPSPGTEWWNGTQLQLWDGSLWKLVGPGGGSVTTTTAVLAVAQPTPAAIGTNAWTIVPFNTTPQVDTMAGFDGVTMKYKPTKSGVYSFNIRGYSTATSGAIGIALSKNDSGSFGAVSDNALALATISSASASAAWMSASAFTTMNGTTDFVRMFGFSSTGGSVYGSGGNPMFMAWALP